MYEIRAIWVHAVQVEALEQRKLLEEDGTLAPRAGLADRVIAVVIGQRLLVSRFPARHVLASQKTAMSPAGHVHDLVGAAEPVDRFGDEAAVEQVARLVDPGLSGSTLGLADDPAVCGCKLGVAKQGPRLGYGPARQPESCRGRPVLLEHSADRLDRLRPPRQHRMPA